MFEGFFIKLPVMCAHTREESISGKSSSNTDNNILISRMEYTRLYQALYVGYYKIMNVCQFDVVENSFCVGIGVFHTEPVRMF